LELRISCSYAQAVYNRIFIGGYTLGDPTVTYDLDYTKWTVNYYDLAGNLRKTVSAMSINCSSPGTINFATTYDYSNLGQLIAEKSADEGLKEILYDSEGKQRFSQNAVQKALNYYSYVNYDRNGRSIENGECRPGSTSASIYFQNAYGVPSSPPTGLSGPGASTIADSLNKLNSADLNEQTYVAYYKLASGNAVPSGYTYNSQYINKEYMGKVSRTWNANNTTWYCYDQAGRLSSLVQQLMDGDYTAGTNSGTTDSQIKTIDYTYDPYTGVVTQEAYQKNVATSAYEKLTHYYTYDADMRLLKSEIDSNGVRFIQAKYAYYITGALKRKELGLNVQGLDYVYTINGQLKSINHPALDATKDPGLDGQSGAHSLFAADVFGMTLDYHQSDYTRSSSNILSSSTSGSPGYYSGLIHAQRWKETGDADADYIVSASHPQLTTGSTTELMFRYSYDELKRFSTSVFGVFNNSTPAFTSRTDFNESGSTTGSTGIAYDDNGNITTLVRNGYYTTGNPTAVMDNLSYTYTSNTNQLASVSDAVTTNAYSDFITTGTGTAFTYDARGQMTADAAENVSAVTYNPRHLTSKVTYNLSGSNTAEYFYNERGVKYKTRHTDNTTSPATIHNTWYVCDASGKVVATYLQNQTATTPSKVYLTQQPLYASGRVGVLSRTIKTIDYEITDHLGNVRATLEYVSGNGTSTQTVVQLSSRTDYYAFGGAIPGRGYHPTAYSYSCKGQESAVNNSGGQSTWKDFQLRMLNTDLGRWMAPDPRGQFHSPYIAMANNPISLTDPDGGFVNFNRDGSFNTPNCLGYGQYYDNYYDYWLKEVVQWSQMFRAQQTMMELNEKMNDNMGGNSFSLSDAMNSPSEATQMLGLLASGLSHQQASDYINKQDITLNASSRHINNRFGATNFQETNFDFFMATFNDKPLGMFGNERNAWIMVGWTFKYWIHDLQKDRTTVASNDKNPILYQNTPVLVNLQNQFNFFKPEGGKNSDIDGMSYPIGPFSYMEVATDGVTSSLHKDEVYKVNDGADVIILPSGEVITAYDNVETASNAFKKILNPSSTPEGWQDKAWGKTNAYNWQYLFVSAQFGIPGMIWTPNNYSLPTGGEHFTWDH
jgi:RHS repeat-associated protein